MSALTLSFRAKLSLVWQISLASDSFNDVLVMCDSGLIIIYDKNSELLRHKIFYEHKSLIKKRTFLSYFLYIAYSAILRRRILLQYLITMFSILAVCIFVRWTTCFHRETVLRKYSVSSFKVLRVIVFYMHKEL